MQTCSVRESTGHKSQQQYMRSGVLERSRKTRPLLTLCLMHWVLPLHEACFCHLASEYLPFCMSFFWHLWPFLALLNMVGLRISFAAIEPILMCVLDLLLPLAAFLDAVMCRKEPSTSPVGLYASCTITWYHVTCSVVSFSFSNTARHRLCLHMDLGCLETALGCDTNAHCCWLTPYLLGSAYTTAAAKKKKMLTLQ